jgi:hypothetical protein
LLDILLSNERKTSLVSRKKTVNIIFVPIFSYLILDKKIYKHHSLALFLGIIGGIIVNFCRFPLGFSYLSEYPFHLLNIFLSLLYSLALVLIKHIMIKYIILSPYLLLFYDGIFCIIISIFITLLEYFIVPKLPKVEGEEKAFGNNNFFYNNFIEIFKIFEQDENKFYVLFFLSMALSFCYYISNIYIIYHYSPFVSILLEIILPIDSDILDYLVFNSTNDHIPDEILKRFLFQMIGYIIIFIASLILNEIIVLNFCGLNTNTYLNILARTKNESVILLNINNEIDSSDNQSETYITGEYVD